MSPEGWFRVEEFAPGTFQFTEGGRWKMFLLIGDKKALLLDSGVGFGDLKALCESITSKPIDHVLTHTHWDHIGSAHRWKSIGVHPNGISELTNDHSQKCTEVIQGWGDGLPFPPEFKSEGYMTPPATFGWEVQEGDSIDLGGRTLHVWDTPGHSPCSISFLDDREGVLITGDLVKPLQPLNLRAPNAVLSDYVLSLRKLEKVATENEVKWVCSGHADAFPDSSIIGEMAQFMEEVEEGKHEPPRKMTNERLGKLDVYQSSRFSAWIKDNARR